MWNTTSTEITLEELEKYHQELVRLANSPNEQTIPRLAGLLRLSEGTFR